MAICALVCHRWREPHVPSIILIPTIALEKLSIPLTIQCSTWARAKSCAPASACNYLVAMCDTDLGRARKAARRAGNVGVMLRLDDQIIPYSSNLDCHGACNLVFAYLPFVL